MELTNEKLYELCKKYGAAARFWRQKFIGLLPEINRRRLFEEKGSSSIFEFAAKLCGLSAEQVRLALNLEKRFEDKPVLRKMLESGEVSINKLTRVVSIATPENEEELAAQLKVLPKSALETLVRDEKAVCRMYTETVAIVQAAVNQNGLQKPLFGDKSLPGQNLKFQIADDIATELNELAEKGIDVNELLREALQQRREKIAQKKQRIAENIQQTSSHHVPVATQRLMKEEFGKKCSIKNCMKPAEQIHHTQRHSLSHNHDPHFLAPLCKNHHIIAHSIDLKYHQARAR